MNDLYIGIDVGATKIRIAVANREMQILKKVVILTPKDRDPMSIPSAIIETIRREFNSFLGNVKAIGVGSIGPLDLARGCVTNAPNVPAKSFPLAEPLMHEFGKPVYIANDCVAAVWGEYIRRHKTVENLVYVTISTGIGGGIILNNCLLLGKDGNGHEIGHIVVDYERRLQCTCGGYGHWEGYCSGASIPRFAKYIVETYDLTSDEKNSPLYSAIVEGRVRTEDIYTYARRGDKLAVRIVNEVTKINCVAFESIANIYDPELIVVGGSVALNNVDLVLKPIVEYMNSSTGVIVRRPRVETTSLGDDVVLFGAISIAIDPPRALLKMLKYLDPNI